MRRRSCAAFSARKECVTPRLYRRIPNHRAPLHPVAWRVESIAMVHCCAGGFHCLPQGSQSAIGGTNALIVAVQQSAVLASISRNIALAETA